MADQPVINDTDVKVANAALGMLASGEIFSWDEDTELAGKVNAIYRDCIDSCLTAFNWSFGRTSRQLTLLADAAGVPLKPDNGYCYGYALPPGRLAPPSAYRSSPRSREPVRDFTIAMDEGGNQNVYCNIKPLWATFKVRPAVALWSPAFRIFATKALAAELAIPVSHDANLAAAFRDEAWGAASSDRRAGLFIKAMAADLTSDSGPEAMYGRDPLTDAWAS